MMIMFKIYTEIHKDEMMQQLCLELASEQHRAEAMGNKIGRELVTGEPV